MPIALVWTEATDRIAVELADREALTAPPKERTSCQHHRRTRWRQLQHKRRTGLTLHRARSGWRVPNPLASLDPILKRDEADILFIVGNLALVAFDLIDWPIAALMLASYAMARSRHKVFQAVAEVAEEAG